MRPPAEGAPPPAAPSHPCAAVVGYCRAEQFSSCAADRPVLAQFCANDPDVFLAAAQLVAPHVDGVDLNLGCPQRIAKRGRYGAFLMDDLPLVEALVRRLAAELPVPVSVKIRMFPHPEDPARPDVARSVEYARRMEAAGASLVAIHGRTRDQKDAKGIRADWAVIKARHPPARSTSPTSPTKAALLAPWPTTAELNTVRGAQEK